ncbi:hypothetical protein DBV15_05370 [Temnothorax longispinosus]|uniref:Uncharacterized protein n=1 Tax=Temnothorax longispinosus TaxID=300112 RepID=A0A4V3S689_9HYME|nr:hypothetical protein DBV15_05370 [Temnothorax longispinosus]
MYFAINGSPTSDKLTVIKTDRSNDGALQHLDILPVGHLQLRRVVLVEVDDHQLVELARRAARLRHPLSVLLPQQALQQGVMVRRVVAGRATALAVAGVEALRVHDELEALQVLEHHRQLVPAALLVVVALALAASALVQRHQLLGDYIHGKFRAHRGQQLGPLSTFYTVSQRERTFPVTLLHETRPPKKKREPI